MECREWESRPCTTESRQGEIRLCSLKADYANVDSQRACVSQLCIHLSNSRADKFHSRWTKRKNVVHRTIKQSKYKITKICINWWQIDKRTQFCIGRDKNTKKTENMIEATRIYVTSFKETRSKQTIYKKKMKWWWIEQERTSFLQEAHIARRVLDTFAQGLTMTHSQRRWVWLIWILRAEQHRYRNRLHERGRGKSGRQQVVTRKCDRDRLKNTFFHAFVVNEKSWIWEKSFFKKVHGKVTKNTQVAFPGKLFISTLNPNFYPENMAAVLPIDTKSATHLSFLLLSDFLAFACINVFFLWFHFILTFFLDILTMKLESMFMRKRISELPQKHKKKKTFPEQTKKLLRPWISLCISLKKRKQ